MYSHLTINLNLPELLTLNDFLLPILKLDKYLYFVMILLLNSIFQMALFDLVLLLFQIPKIINKLC